MYLEETNTDRAYKWVFSLVMVLLLLFIVNVLYSVLAFTWMNWIHPFKSVANAVWALLQIALLTVLVRFAIRDD